MYSTTELEAERAELMAKNAAATSWGAAVGARHERIMAIDRTLEALRRSSPSTSGAELVALDPLEMLLDAARYAEGNGGKYRNLEWAKAARAAVAKARLVAQDHGGADAGVGECEPIAFMFWNEPDTQRHFTQLKETIGSHWSRVQPLYARPAPVAANASAEAWLREALQSRHAMILSNAAKYKWKKGEGAWNRAYGEISGLNFAFETLSPDPHASDCARETEDDEWALRLSGDETTKSDETGIRVEDNHRSRGASLQQGPDTSSNPSTVAMLQGKGSDAANVANPVATSDRASHVAPVSLDPLASDCDKQGER